MFAKNYINASIFVILSFISLGFAQFNDTQITYEYNENRIRDYETYILDDFTEKIKKYYDISNFSYDLNDLNLNLKIHFIFDEISFSGEDNYNAVSCQFIISNSSDQFYYIKNIKFPFKVTSKTPPDDGLISANIPNFEFNELLKLRALGS